MNRENNNPCGLGYASVIRVTDKAICVSLDGNQFWVPKSVIHDDSEVWCEDNEPGELVVAYWWATKNGHA